uniref:Arabinogalactan protein n=1 Tax=Oryza meridionalis TaxID=40149 RepID=A0A0E0E0M7_9ORYZ
MSRATVAILFYILTVAAISAAAQAPAESPKPSKGTAAATPAKAPTVASAPRKAGPAAAPTTEATSAPAGGDEVSIPHTPFATVVSPTVDGPAEGPADAADADNSGAVALKRCAAVAGVAAAIATVIFY